MDKISENDAKQISSKTARSFRLDYEENNLLKSYAKKHHQNDSEVIRGLIATLAFKGTENEIKIAEEKRKKVDTELAKSVQDYNRKMDQIIALKQATYFLLRNLTNNVNQVAHWVNLNGSNVDHDALKKLLKQIREQERQIKLKIDRIDAKNDIKGLLAFMNK